jgi:hypothetical protein
VRLDDVCDELEPFVPARCECAWCEQEIPLGDLAMMSTEALDPLCTPCVAGVSTGP